MTALTAGCGGGGGGSSDAPAVAPLLCSTARLTGAPGGGTASRSAFSIGSGSIQPGAPRPSAKVLNGVACESAANSVASIRFTSASSDVVQRCSGVLITKQVVLSAAHCFLGLKGIRADVQVGGTTVRARTVAVHPGARFTESDQAIFDDVALLTLPSALADGRPLPLLVSSAPRVGDRFSIFGFGLSEGGKFGELRGGEMTAKTVTANHIIASFDGSLSNSCDGDSGGPAVVAYKNGGVSTAAVVGLVSSGVEASQCKKGDISYFALLSSPEVEEFLRARAPRATFF